MNWGFPESVSTFGGRIDSIFELILLITGVIFLVVEIALIYFVIRYRRRPGVRAEYVHGHTRTEVVWTLIPFALVVLIAWSSADVWFDLKVPERFPANALELKVTAKQFEWNVTYPGADNRLDTPDDFVKRNQLHVPVGMPVRVHLGAEDVIHSFFLPEFRVKQDAVPGLPTQTWFQALRTGTFMLGCAELCGLGHYRMKGTVTVHTMDEFDAWSRSQAPAPAAAAAEAPARTAMQDHAGAH